MFSLTDSVGAALERTGVPDVAAAFHADGRTAFAGSAERPFRIASITKSFTATLLAESGLLEGAEGGRRRALLSHTAGYRPEAAEPLPAACAGLWSYSNAGYWEAASVFDDYSAALRERVLEPLGLVQTGFETPADGVPGNSAAGPLPHAPYPVSRRPGGGLWSTVADLVTYGLAHCSGYVEVHEPVAEALGAQYALGWWVRDGVLDHEGSVAGYQSLLLVVPERELVLAVLTSSWRGSALIKQVVEDLGVIPTGADAQQVPADGIYALGDIEASVADGWITEREHDPVAGGLVERRYRVSLDAALMSHRCDSPRPGVARIGWTALPSAS